MLDALLGGGRSRDAREKLVSSNITTLNTALENYQTDEAVNIYHAPHEPTVDIVAISIYSYPIGSLRTASIHA